MNKGAMKRRDKVTGENITVYSDWWFKTKDEAEQNRLKKIRRWGVDPNDIRVEYNTELFEVPIWGVRITKQQNLG